MIAAVVEVISPVVIPGPSEDGTVKLILNVSFPSTMLSLITVMFIVLLLVPAIIVTVSGAESKSMLLPTCENSKHNTSCSVKIRYDSCVVFHILYIVTMCIL